MVVSHRSLDDRRRSYRSRNSPNSEIILKKSYLKGQKPGTVLKRLDGFQGFRFKNALDEFKGWHEKTDVLEGL